MRKKRRDSRVVWVGEVPVGGDHPIVVQSMTTTDTRNVEATVKQIISLQEAGCELIRVAVLDREGASVQGLTTAAGLWVVACIGLAVGAGLYVPAIATTILILFVLIYFIKFEARFTGRREYKGIVMVVEDKPGQVGIIGSILGDLCVLIKNIQLTQVEDNYLEIEVLLQIPAGLSVEQVIEELSNVKGLRSIERLN
jgi:putative Mg2+ transporter-C (MgtC) family protein